MTPAALTAWPVFFWSLIKALLPFPTPSVLALAGAAIDARDGRLSTLAARLLWRVAIPGSAGMTLGSIPYYVWARRYGRATLDRFLRGRQRWKKTTERLEKAIARRPILSTFLMRALPVVPLALGSLLIGLSDCSWLDFAVWTFIGDLARSVFLASVGHLARAAFVSVILPGGATAWLAGGVAAVCLLATGLTVVGARRPSSS